MRRVLNPITIRWVVMKYRQTLTLHTSGSTPSSSYTEGTSVTLTRSVVNRVFRLVRVEKRGSYTVAFVSDGTKEWDVTFRVDDDNDTMNLLVPQGEEVHRPLPMHDR